MVVGGEKTAKTEEKGWSFDSKFIDAAHVKQLQESRKAGYFQPIVINKKNGRILIGRHRYLADREWPLTYIETDDPLTEEIIIMSGFVQRQPREEETRERLLTIAEMLKAKGIPENRICVEISKLPGMTLSYSRIRELIPSNFKMPTVPKPKVPMSSLPHEEAIIEGKKKAEKTMAALTGLRDESGEPALPYKECLCKGCSKLHECY